MNKFTTSLLAMSLLLGGCGGGPVFHANTTEGILTKDGNSTTLNTRLAYRVCLADMNRRQRGTEAVVYCREEMRKALREAHDISSGKSMKEPPREPILQGTSMMGPSAMMGPGGYRQGTFLPIYSAPLGPMDYEGSTADPRTSSQAASAGEAKRQSGSSGSSADDKAVLDQIARNAEEARKAQERLDRLEAERSQNE